jgi:hypothetical protein
MISWYLDLLLNWIQSWSMQQNGHARREYDGKPLDFLGFPHQYSQSISRSWCQAMGKYAKITGKHRAAYNLDLPSRGFLHFPIV